LKKREPKKQLNLTYDEKGTDLVSEHIMDAYNSGVMDQKNGQFVWEKSKK
jgi:hypothetical protein